MTDSMAVREASLPLSTNVNAPETVSCSGNAFVVHVRLADGLVDKAWSTGRMVRNMNVLLKGELDGRGRPRFVNQPHCLCNDGHALAAIRAVENLAGVDLPHTAALVRRVVQSLRCIQEHLLHFYQFHLADWASLDSALSADAAKAARLGATPGEDAPHYRAVQERLTALAAARSEVVPVAGYRGSPESHLLLYGHSLQAIRVGATLQTALGLLGCGPGGFTAYRLGGLPSDFDLGPPVLDRLRVLLEECRPFLVGIFSEDLARIANAYGAWAELGRGQTFLSWDDDACGGFIEPGGDAQWRLREQDGCAVSEELEPEWGDGDRDLYRLIDHVNRPSFHWDCDDAFWLPAPRHGRAACEVGPLARVFAGHLCGRYAVERVLPSMLDKCGLSLRTINSTLGRVLARGVECAAGMEAVFGWLDELESVFTPGSANEVEFGLPASGVGVGRVEVPRGTLAHTVAWEQGRIVRHDYLIPSLWNFSPRDSFGEPGPLECALEGTPVADPDHPVEILRTLHQLDPCNACHVVIEDRDTGRTSLATA